MPESEELCLETSSLEYKVDGVEEDGDAERDFASRVVALV